MSTNHGETVMQKPISEIAEYIKNVLPANIPETYGLKPMFENIGEEENIRKGVAAFRDFLYLFCDRLISDGHLFVAPKKTKNPSDYPFLHNINNLLVDMGYYGRLNENVLMIDGIPLFTSQKPKITGPKIMECLRFLALCGFVFKGIDLEAKAFKIGGGPVEVTYPDNPILLTGLKAMSAADMELRKRRYSNDDNLLRCDYRLIKRESTDIIDVLKDYLHMLPERTQKTALELHQRYLAAGMTCAENIWMFNARIGYSYVKNSRKALSPREVYDRRMWEFLFSLKHGNCLVVRAKKTDKYMDIIEKFPLALQEKIVKGYGCDRLRRGEPCQHGCQGILIPLDDSILNIKRDIETWLDYELESYRK